MSDVDTIADIQPSHHWPPAPIGTTIGAEHGGGTVGGPFNQPTAIEATTDTTADVPALMVGEDTTVDTTVPVEDVPPVV